jgi:hypothetical protein
MQFVLTESGVGGETRKGLQPYSLWALVSLTVTVAPLVDTVSIWFETSSVGLEVCLGEIAGIAENAKIVNLKSST